MLMGGEVLIAELKDLSRKYKYRAADVGFMDADSASLAYYMEFGFMNSATRKFVQPRPFMRVMLERQSVRKAVADAMAEAAQEGKNSKQIVSAGAKVLKSSLVEAVRSHYAMRANAPATIKKKGFDRPLYETGQLMRSVRISSRGSRLEEAG